MYRVSVIPATVVISNSIRPQGPIVMEIWCLWEIVDTDPQPIKKRWNLLWINPGTPDTDELLIDGGAASLSSPDVNVSSRTPYYIGDYDLPFVGDTGWGDPNSCSGTIESVIVQPLISL